MGRAAGAVPRTGARPARPVGPPDAEPLTDYLDAALDLPGADAASVIDELSFWSSRFGALLLEHLELVGGVRALDLGCGTGFPLFELAHVHGAGARFTGVDTWAAALARAAARRRTYAWLANVALVRADGAWLPFRAATFDLMGSNLGINNFASPADVAAECFRVGRAGARLVLTTNLTGHMALVYDCDRETLRELGLERYLDRLAASEAHRGTPGSVSRLVEGAGFRVSRVVTAAFDRRYLDGSALLRHSLTRLGFLPGWRAVVDPADERAVFARLEAKLNDRARRAGELRLEIPALYLEARKAG